MTKTWITVLCSAVAALAGAYAGYVDLHNDDVQAPVLVILVSSFLLALAQPGRSWLFALIMGGCIPLAHVYARSIGMSLPYETTLPGTFLAFIPALLGAGAGAVLRKGAGVVLS